MDIAEFVLCWVEGVDVNVKDKVMQQKGLWLEIYWAIYLDPFSLTADKRQREFCFDLHRQQVGRHQVFTYD